MNSLIDQENLERKNNKNGTNSNGMNSNGTLVDNNNKNNNNNNNNNNKIIPYVREVDLLMETQTDQMIQIYGLDTNKDGSLKSNNLIQRVFEEIAERLQRIFDKKLENSYIVPFFPAYLISSLPEFHTNRLANALHYKKVLLLLL